MSPGLQGYGRGWSGRGGGEEGGEGMGSAGGREIHTYKTSTLQSYISLGTHLKWYIQEGNNFYDITPIDNTTAIALNVRTTG